MYIYIKNPTTKKVGHSVQKWGINCNYGVPKCGGIVTSRLGHCDFEIGALRLGSRGINYINIATGAFRQWGIPTTFLIQLQIPSAVSL